MTETIEPAHQASLGRFDLTGQVALITGAASGLGQAIATGLAAAGARVALADLDQQAVEQARQRIDPSGQRSLALGVDVRQRASVEALLAGTLERFAQVDILVNSAGITIR